MSKVDVSDIVRAMRTLVEAQSEHDRARAAYDGYSWGYHGAGLIFEVDKAENTLAERLNSYIDQRIDEKLSQRQEGAE